MRVFGYTLRRYGTVINILITEALHLTVEQSAYGAALPWFNS